MPTVILTRWLTPINANDRLAPNIERLRRRVEVRWWSWPALEVGQQTRMPPRPLSRTRLRGCRCGCLCTAGAVTDLEHLGGRHASVGCRSDPVTRARRSGWSTSRRGCRPPIHRERGSSMEADPPADHDQAVQHTKMIAESARLPTRRSARCCSPRWSGWRKLRRIAMEITAAGMAWWRTSADLRPR